MSLHSKQSLYQKLFDKKYRDAFVSSRIAQTIAMQARVLRQRKELSQTDLARSLGTSQNAIYRLENPKYGRPNISTLKKLASFYDVGLVVRFAPHSELADWTLNLSEKSMDVPDFNRDTGFVERKDAQSARALVDNADHYAKVASGDISLAVPIGGGSATATKNVGVAHSASRVIAIR